jgi:hypothetical protein
MILQLKSNIKAELKIGNPEFSSFHIFKLIIFCIKSFVTRKYKDLIKLLNSYFNFSTKLVVEWILLLIYGKSMSLICHLYVRGF